MNTRVSGASWNLWGVGTRAGSRMEPLLRMRLAVLLPRSAHGINPSVGVSHSESGVAGSCWETRDNAYREYFSS